MDEVTNLTTQANKAYALESYDEAADLYAQAYEKIVRLNGEDNTENAHLMLLYGRTLVKIALKKSEVLGGGGTVLQERPANENNASSGTAADARFSFQGDGDVNEDEEEEAPDQAEQPSVEDEFQDAWEILDLARISYGKRVDAATKGEDKQENKKRLAEVYDLLGEISLENGKFAFLARSRTLISSENFDQAVGDLKMALTLKQELHDESSSQVSSAHYMLALALEYCTSEAARKEAVTEVEHAIASFEGRISKMDKDTPQHKDEAEMLEELRLKLTDLKTPKSDETKELVKNVFSGEGAALKESVIQAMQSSNDLSSLVRKKEKKRPATSDGTDSAETKKVKTEDGVQASAPEAVAKNASVEDLKD